MTVICCVLQGGSLFSNSDILSWPVAARQGLPVSPTRDMYCACRCHPASSRLCLRHPPGRTARPGSSVCRPWSWNCSQTSSTYSTSCSSFMPSVQGRCRYRSQTLKQQSRQHCSAALRLSCAHEHHPQHTQVKTAAARTALPAAPCRRTAAACLTKDLRSAPAASNSSTVLPCGNNPP